MPFELFVALRYLLAKRKQTLISIVTLISVAGVGSGVAALIIALALNSGFQKEFQDRILGATSHVNLLRLGNLPIQDYRALADRLRKKPEVVVVSPTVYSQAQLASDLNRARGVILRGVDPQRREILGDLFEKIVEGDPTRFDVVAPVPSMMVGKQLADELGLLVGDYVRAFGRQGQLSPLGRLTRVQNFEIVAIFESGLWDYDANWALIPIGAAQRFEGLSVNEVSVLEFKISDIYAASEVAERLLETAGSGFTAQTWIELNRPLFSALRLEKLALFIAIGLIVMVASLNIVSTLTLMVMEKNRDIAVIAAMGGTPRTITGIFVLQGLIIGMLGTSIGAVLGWVSVWYMDTYKVFRLEPQVYSIPYVPFEASLGDALLVCLLAILICLGATLYPARAASKLDPVEAIRYE